MTELGYEHYLTEMPAEAARFVEAVAGADTARRVPTCPEWTLADLITHVGRAHHWAADIVSSGAQQPLPNEAEPPQDPAQHVQWVLDGAERLRSAVAEVGVHARVWTPTGRGAGYWLRRIAHDTVVHRADAAFTTGGRYEVDPALAADGITEFLELLPALIAVRMSPGLAELPGTGQSLHFHATDLDGGEWLVHRVPEGISWEHTHGKADVAVRGRAVDLQLVLTNRIGVDDPRVQVFGAVEELVHWRRCTTF
ncbi:maleylpyruvate isomerase family mycothiol-dependent enzyme [Kutzneria viridogrisea]|uniref:Uncharacterized protein (TIGR03083 family) n=1 Tax=Kutzneria viridogrisea TaxID=47990 RepID=A0ABR6BBU8_9PSEU|nr:uncharacterized protein (TIGR03083 family) [Kutzneria viridogrisea]